MQKRLISKGVGGFLLVLIFAFAILAAYTEDVDDTKRPEAAGPLGEGGVVAPEMNELPDFEMGSELEPERQYEVAATPEPIFQSAQPPPEPVFQSAQLPLAESQQVIPTGVVHPVTAAAGEQTGIVATSLPAGNTNCVDFFLGQWEKRPSSAARVFLFALVVLLHDSKPDVRLQTVQQLRRLFTVLQRWPDLGISLDLMKGLPTCIIDTEAGYTIGMRIVRMGFSLLTEHPFFKSIFLSSNLLLTDKKLNNYFHLAASSGDVTTLQHVHTAFLACPDITDAKMFELLQNRNQDGKTPLDIATANGAVSIADQLKQFYVVAQVGQSKQGVVQWQFPNMKEFLSPIAVH